MSASVVRRTQQERREETIGRILDATITALAELGCTATTIGEVCRRSGVSSGGVFRHFPTRLDLMIAAADAVRERQFANFEAGLAALGDEHADISESLRVCLELLRTACRAPMNAAWYELLGAARTDPALREHLTPMAERYHAQIVDLGRSLPVAARFPADVFDTLLLSLVHMFDGEALASRVHPQPELEVRRIELMARMLALVTSDISSNNEQ
ncbi:TetR family transcriptional regulator [Rhodococcus sp. 852002-51564_SCH6189132-a]|uniref:TetR/AcrR family transcriptional regulator n=1 Tax=Rhodococcus sp. 852002-51564_SCH6189132-a TaxID=1834103 RepID=UPI0007EB3B40|nr:TetR/AcrR family transcriptional regulator [Rhodococcus sp. 852002-51564_SCH6189132-a]OBA30622.1 TetR family transcriptional regulator [Rhodococcus sp. 852002-51564_SCH6189132-a]